MLAQVYLMNLKERGFWNRTHPDFQRLVQAMHHSSLDVFLFQFPSGHSDFANLQVSDLDWIVDMASALFQATTVILPTIPWYNNMFPGQVQGWQDANDLIRAYAVGYNTTRHSAAPERMNTSTTTTSAAAATTVKTVQVLDFANLSVQLLEANAHALGISVNETYTLRLVNRK